RPLGRRRHRYRVEPRQGRGKGGKVAGQARRPTGDVLDEEGAARQIGADRQHGMEPRRRAGGLGAAEAGRLVSEVVRRGERPLRQPRHAQHETARQPVMRVRDALLAHRQHLLGVQARDQRSGRAVARQEGGDGGGGGRGDVVRQGFTIGGGGGLGGGGRRGKGGGR